MNIRNCGLTLVMSCMDAAEEGAEFGDTLGEEDE